MWILILTIIIGANHITATSISTVPVTFNDYNVCMDAGKHWATDVKAVMVVPHFVCVKHFSSAR